MVYLVKFSNSLVRLGSRFENMPLGLVAHTGLAGTFIYIYREREKERLRSIFGTTSVTPN